MEPARVTHFGPGPRLASLAALLRTAAGAPVQVVADLADGLALPRGSIGCLVLDLGAMPLDDLGLLRRLRARQPGLAVLWTGPAALAAALAAVADAGDEFRPWPLDVTRLPGFQAAGTGAADRESAPRHALVREESPAVSLREALDADAGGHAAPGSAPLAVPPGSVLDPDLRHIEAILAGFERGAEALSPPTGAPPAERFTRATDVGTPGRAEGRRAAPAAAGPRVRAAGGAHDLEHEQEEEDLEVLDPDGADLGSPFVSDGPLLSHEELEAFLAPEPSALDAPPVGAPMDTEGHPGAAPKRAVQALPHWYRDQVADLADLVQRAELALHAVDSASANHPGPAGERPEALGGVRLELGRLRQFARTLGCLAAPPAAGTTRLDLGVLVEETLASLAQRAPEAGGAVAAGARIEGRPRFLFRSQAGVEVQADKGLLVAALDAVLGVAAAAGGAADVVRTEVLTTDAGVAEVRVDLPEGRLAGLDPARILEPYALRRRMPGIGAHALAAAGGILVGHGGDLVVERRSQGPSERARLLFALRLPAR